MPSSPRRTDTLLQQPLAYYPSDYEAAETAPKTVMAEQVSHNVVNESQSTSASVLVDVAANQTTTASAEYGSYDGTPTSTLSPETKSTPSEASLTGNEHAIQTNALVSSMGTAGSVEGSGGVAGTAPRIALDNGAAEHSRPNIGIDDTAPLVDSVADDISIREGSVDVSLNSDTEGSRGDTSELKKDDKHHVRTNSVKKPITFSKVSVTKNFLAKSVTTAPPAAKPGDRPSPAGTPLQPSAAKPRLIAKTGTSLRDVQKARLSADATHGPDASKVWNKNRPVPPPPPKQFTDEELKQQYGIHLATRLQTDEEGKQSKWADIDDDEEDWAPDTVEWMDGTKSTLTSHETAQPPQKDQKSPSALPAKPTEPVRPTLIVKKPVDLGASMTVLKPGANAAAAQARQGELGVGTSSERSSETGRGVTSLPAKSPWAVLPPVDKVSPINPPVQQRQPPQFATQDARVLEQLPPPPPAREIAADTFARSWREGEGGTRELFNSANGRYEPVQEGRRGSIKPDSGYRKPSVLQRPSQNSAIPAEPSAAFQTRTASQHDSPWARRRGSSVSQNSFPQGRRVSTPKTSEASPAPERRASNAIGHDMRASPTMARTDPVPPSFPQQSAWQQQMPQRPEEVEDPVKVQERVMKEKRDEARKRHEEEARQEAEKKERLKAKLAALTGAGKSRKEREAEAAAAAAAAATPASTVGANATENGPENPFLATTTDEKHGTQAEHAEPSVVAAPALPTQVLPPTVEAAGSKRPSSDESLPSPIPPKQAVSNPPDRPVTSSDQVQRPAPRSHLSPRASARAPFQQGGPQFKPPNSSYSSPGDRKQQPFERSPLTNNNAFSPWPTTGHTGSVWGTSGIGNGTFESSNVFAPVPMSHQQSSLPPPPGMSRQPGSTRISPQSLASESRSPSLQQQSVAEPARPFGPPGLESRADAFASQGRASGASPAPGLGRQTHLPGPIAPPSRAQQHAQPSQRQASLAAWNSAVHSLPSQYRADAEEAEQRAHESIPMPRDDTFRETFKQTSIEQGRLGGPRKFEKTEYTIHDVKGSRSVQSLSPAPPVTQSQPPAPPSTASPLAQDPWKSAGDNTVRIPDGSLNPAHGGVLSRSLAIRPASSQQPSIIVNQVNADYSATQNSTDQSPPPPETMSHPVYSGEGGHPHVKLPPKKPTVKLPPSQGETQQPHVPQHAPVMPHRPTTNWGPPGSSRPLVMQEAWQARFNGLFNRTPIQTETPPSPPKTPPKMQGPSLAVTSSTRAVMAESASNATVSLPLGKKSKSVEGFTIDDNTDTVSKGMIEQMFKEELSFGSLPIISIPKRPQYAHSSFFAASSEPSLPMRVEALSRPEFNMLDVHAKRRDGCFVHLPTTKLIRRFVKQPTGHRKPSGMHQERRTSGKFPAKGHDAGANAASGTLNAQSRRTSSQKTAMASSSPPVTTPATNSKETGRKTQWPKPPRGRNSRVLSTAQAA